MQEEEGQQVAAAVYNEHKSVADYQDGAGRTANHWCKEQSGDIVVLSYSFSARRCIKVHSVSCLMTQARSEVCGYNWLLMQRIRCIHAAVVIKLGESCCCNAADVLVCYVIFCVASVQRHYCCIL